MNLCSLPFKNPQKKQQQQKNKQKKQQKNNQVENKKVPSTVFAKTAGLSDKISIFLFCPVEKFSFSDKCPVISCKTR